MSADRGKQDLIVLAADGDMQAALEAIFRRPEALGTRQFSAQVIPHAGHDPGCRGQGVTFLRTFLGQFHHAILIFDLEGSGREEIPAIELEAMLDRDLIANGWQSGSATTIVIEPELESWFWSQSIHVDRVTGWSGRLPSLRDWLSSEGLLTPGQAKPQRPKEALRRALRQVRKPPSSSLFRQLGERVTFSGCQDRAFLKLRQTLQRWFPR